MNQLHFAVLILVIVYFQVLQLVHLIQLWHKLHNNMVPGDYHLVMLQSLERIADASIDE